MGLTSVYDSYNLLLKLDKLGFQLSKQGRQELPGLILQSVIVLLVTIKIKKTGIPTQQAMVTEELPGLILQSIVVIWTDTSVYGR